MWNSIITSNSTTNSPDSPNWFGGALNYCCSTPLPGTGAGNITDAPLFADQPGGNFQLQINSQCINAGTNSYVLPGADLAGNSRIVGGTVDLGAYECQSPALLALFAWFQSYGLSTHASSTEADADQDGMNNRQEWVAGTVPTNASFKPAAAIAYADKSSKPGDAHLVQRDQPCLFRHALHESQLGLLAAP